MRRNRMKGFDRIARNAQIEREDLRRTLLCARICAALGRTRKRRKHSAVESP